MLLEACSGRHVARRPHHRSGFGLVAVIVHPLGQAKVGDLGLTFTGKQNIGRFLNRGE